MGSILTTRRTNPTADLGYDIFLIAGQSNTYSSTTSSGDTCPNPTLDSTDEDIKQWGRFDGEDGTVITAEEPLDHIGYLGARPPSDKVGWALTFAKMYKAQGHLGYGRKILLVPCGEGGSGFADNKWNQGDADYNDAKNRVLAALAEGAGNNQLKAILWHQGEDESGNATNAANHAAALLAMIDAFRSDFGLPNLPFIAGGLIPALVSAPVLYYDVTNANIEAIVTARKYTGYADPASPTELTAEGVASGSNNHYSSYSMRGSSQDFSDYTTLGFAGRYYVAYLSALENK